MKRFIKEITIFLLIIFMSFLGAFFFSMEIIKLKIKSHPIILLGDSQTKHINISSIYNNSIDGSPYFVHYIFAKEFINQLKGKKIYISYNFHNLSKLYENRLANDNLYPGWKNKMIEHMNDYNLIKHSLPEIDKYKKQDENFFNYKMPIRLIKHILISNHRENTNKSISDTLSIKKAIYRHWYNPKYILNDNIQRKYLHKLITLLKENNCEVVLIRMPITNYYIENVPQNIKDEFYYLPKKYQVRLLDLNDKLALSKNYTYFKDYGHLNKLGDSLILRYLIERENVLNIDN